MENKFSKVNIDDISVYNPKTENIYLQDFIPEFKSAFLNNPKKAYRMYEQIRKKTLQSNIGYGITLKDFLYEAPSNQPGEKSYFTANPQICSLTFLDGRLHSRQTNKDINLEKIQEDSIRNNSLPVLIFNNKIPEVKKTKNQVFGNLLIKILEHR